MMWRNLSKQAGRQDKEGTEVTCVNIDKEVAKIIWGLVVFLLFGHEDITTPECYPTIMSIPTKL